MAASGHEEQAVRGHDMPGNGYSRDDAKGGIVSMTTGPARTYGPHGITANTVAPGFVRTPMLTSGLDGPALDELVRQVPLRRIAEPHNLAGTVLFLASNHAACITGATINMSGGFLTY